MLVLFMGTLLALPCNGAELVISDPIPALPLKYPPEVYTMTDGEFYTWATEQNAKARAEWDEWYETAEPRWLSYDATDYERHHNRSQKGRGISYYDGNTGYEQRFVVAGRSYGTRSGTTRHYQKRYLNPDYVSRPLTIINPYCRPRRLPEFPVIPVW
jgi:hypothetical protein